ncbi:hypothetical protein ACFRLW_42295, partial [Streptomyces sp. NPDC056728]
GHVRRTEDYFRQKLSTLLPHPLVGDLRGDGFHYSLELVTDKAGREWAAQPASTDFVAQHLGPALVAEGILCRAAVDHEGTPLIQFSPPLVFDRHHIDWLTDKVRLVLDRCATAAGLTR